MATLIKCFDCGKKVDVTAKVCPNCSASVQQSVEKADRRAENKSAIWAYATGVLFIITGLGAFQISVPSALMLIIGGTLALPLLRKMLIKRNVFPTDKPLIIASAAMIIFGVIGYTQAVKSDRLKNMEENPEVAVSEQSPRQNNEG
jgi:glucose dehydrogenase